MLHINKLIDPDLLAEMVAQKYVKVQTHPEHSSLRIWNYTPAAIYDQIINPATQLCRGLITQNDYIIARPFAKFYNLEQHDLAPAIYGTIPWNEPWTLYDKADGSLLISYPHPAGGYAVATRGSFASDQAKHANQLWNRDYAHIVKPHPDWTILAELITKWNRIVVNYGDADHLVLLGAIHIETGEFLGPDTTRMEFGWPGPIIDTYPVSDIKELQAEDIANREGYVCYFPQSNFRCKMKFDTYKVLHGVMTRTNTKTVWEAVSSGTEIERLSQLPDELWAWITAEVEHLRLGFTLLMDSAKWHFCQAEKLPTRKDQADYLKINAPDVKAIVFRLLDGRNADDVMWKMLRPSVTEFWKPDMEDEA